MVLMIGVFVVGVVAFLQVSIGQIAFGLRDELVTWPLFVMLAAMVLYIVFDLYMVNRIIAFAEEKIKEAGHLEEE